MNGYYLFRGDLLIDKVTNESSLGANDLHNLGQPGDILVWTNGPKRFARWAWSKGSLDGQIRSWLTKSTSPEIEAKYRTLILLQG